MYNTIRLSIETALRGDAGLDRSTVDGYDHEISIVASHLNNRLRQSVRQLEEEAVAIGLDRSEVRAALVRAGLVEDSPVQAQQRPVPAVSGGVVPQQGAVSSKAVPRLPDPRPETPRRSFLQRLFGG